MAKRKKNEPASQAESIVDSEIPMPSVEVSVSPVQIDSPPQEHDLAEKQNDTTPRSDLINDEPGRRTSFPDPNVPFSIAHDNQAGLRLLKFERYKQVQLAFSMPAAYDVDRRLVESGWRYRPDERVYTKQYGEHGAATAIVEAKRLYDELVEELLDEKGLSRSNTR